MAKLKVAVLFGGRSGEHEVSVVSAQSVMGALDKEKYEVVPIKIEQDGSWHGNFVFTGDPKRNPHFDVVFPVLHGPFGEDGTIQGLLELANLAYVGCGVACSAAAMDKALMRALFAQAGLPLVAWEVVKAPQWKENKGAISTELEKTLGYPMFVKPANLGSSVGISKVTSPAGLIEAIELALQYDGKIIIEQGVINAREIECSILGNHDPKASVLGEIVPAHEFYDYTAKYHNDNSRLIIPAPLSEEQTHTIQDYALKAFQAVDGSGLGRVDFLLDAQGRVFVNEINTMPGFTSISMYPKLWEQAGLPYALLLDRLIELALERHGEKQKLRISAF